MEQRMDKQYRNLDRSAIEELRNTYQIVMEIRNYIMLVDGTVLKKDEAGKYSAADIENDAFARELYDIAHPSPEPEMRVYEMDENGRIRCRYVKANGQPGYDQPGYGRNGYGYGNTQPRKRNLLPLILSIVGVAVIGAAVAGIFAIRGIVSGHGQRDSNSRDDTAVVSDDGGNHTAAVVSDDSGDNAADTDADDEASPVGDISWTLEDGVLTIFGTGDMNVLLDKDEEVMPWGDDGESITKVVIESGVTTIGDCAFCECDMLTEVTIPDTVSTIGDEAFWGCVSLTSIEIPDTVTTIGEEAFYACELLEAITIPDGVTTISEGLLWDCYELIEVTIPDDVTTIGPCAFENCDKLTAFEIPDSVTEIGNCAFCNCDMLASITIPDSVTAIGDWAFDECVVLTDVYYAGSESDWAAVTIGEDNKCLTDASIHYGR